MTIDEAIKHCEEVATEKEDNARWKLTPTFQDECIQCAADHRQLAEWLTELKEAKRLLKAAVEDLSVTVAEVYNGGLVCECCKWKSQIDGCCCPDDGGCDVAYRWRYADEVEKLLNDEK